MPNRISDGSDILITTRGNPVEIFDKHKKFTKVYLKRLNTHVATFLNKENHGNASRSDVANFLEQRGFINETIQGNPEFIAFLNSKVPERRTGLSVDSEVNTIYYMMHTIRVDPKYTHKKMTKEDVMNDLKKTKMKKGRLSKNFTDMMKAMISRHNAEYTKKGLKRFEKSTTNKFKFSLAFEALVWNEQQEKKYNDKRNMSFFFDTETPSTEVIEEAVEMYYAQRDYPDFIQLIRHKLTHLDSKASIGDMELLDVICGKKYRSNYIKSNVELIEGFDEKVNEDRCAEIMLRIGYKSLVSEGLIPKEKLTRKYMDTYFWNEAEQKPKYTVNRIIDFVKHLKYASVYIFDQIGKELIAEHKAYDEYKIVNLHTASVVALVGNHHIEQVTDPNVKHSVANTETLTIFNTNRAFEEEQFEFINDPMGLALSFDEESKTEFKEGSKDVTAPVILFDRGDVIKIMAAVSDKYNVVITNIMDDQQGEVASFIHPITQQLYSYQESYHERKEMCEMLYNVSKNEAFKWKCQTIHKLAQLAAEHLDLVDMKVVKAELSAEDRNMYMKNPISQAISRDGNDTYLKYNGKRAGNAKTYTFDANKHYSSALKFREQPYIVSTMWDTWEAFNLKKHGDIPFGEYLLKGGSYGCRRTRIYFNHSLYSYNVIRELLRRKIIRKNDILMVKLVKQILPADYFKDYVDRMYEILPAKYAKQVVNSFIGGLNMLTNKKAHYYVTDNKPYAISAYNFYENRGYGVDYIDAVDDNVICLSFKKLTPNYVTGSCIWRQIQEDGILRLMDYMLSCMVLRSIIIAYNTDSFTIINPKPEAIEEAIRVTEIKDNVETIGKLRLEGTVKVKGLPFEFRSEYREPYFAEKPETKIYKREDNVTEIQESFLINAKLAGSGKTWLLVSLYNEDTLVLLPTHEALQNVLRTAKEQGIKVDPDRIKVIANYFTEDYNKISWENQIRGLKKYKRILIDEVYQCNMHDLQKLYYAKLKFAVQLIGAGAFDQVTQNNLYDLKFNEFFRTVLFDGTVVELEYLKAQGRFTDDLDEILVKVMETGGIPPIFHNQVADLNHGYHLTVTKDLRNKIAKACSIRYCSKLQDKKVIRYKDMIYGVGMEIRCINNFEIDKVKVKNKRIFVIKNIKGNRVTIESDNIVLTVEVYVLYQQFIGNFASTIDSIQGCKITEKYSIWQMDHWLFNLNRLNSSMGRAVSKNLIHFSNPSHTKVYEWQKYKRCVVLKSKPNNINERYQQTKNYLVNLNNEYYYRGHTFKHETVRLEEHFLESMTNPTSKFHKRLAITDHSKVTIEVTETQCFSNRSQAEYHEMMLLEQDIKRFGKDKMLNTRHRKKEVKEIKESIVKTISAEEYKKLEDGKQIHISITVNKKLQYIILRYTLNGKQERKKKGFARIGLEEAMRQVEEMKEEIERELNNNFYLNI
jgi:hypothetical protein